MNTRICLKTKNLSLPLATLLFKTVFGLLLCICSAWASTIDSDDDGFKNLQLELGAGSSANHSCALDADGVKCWGWNDDGQSSSKVLSNPQIISSGTQHTCAIDDDGVKCWGDNSQNQSSVPKLGSPYALSLGQSHSCALHFLGVKCWGNNTYGQTIEPDLNNPIAVSAGGNHNCAIANGEVICWGKNTDGEATAPDLQNARAISAGFRHSCAIDDSGVHCWGFNDNGQTNVPNDLINPVAVSAGGFHTCAIDANGVHCWGAMGFDTGQIVVPPLSNPVAISAGVAHTCALDDNGVQCWGNNAYGQTNLPQFALLQKDNCTSTYNLDQLDTDSDKAGNACDSDDDNDGVLDGNDALPLDAAESLDTDGDGIGNNADADDDGDSVPDVSDKQPTAANLKRTLTATSKYDGWLLESTESSKKGGKADSKSTTLIIGDSAKDQEYRSILHFDTAILPNSAVITKATLKFKKQSSKGNVKKLGKLVVDMKQKNFGSKASLATNDFEATAGKKSVGTFKASGKFYSAVLSTTGKNHISKTAATQFKLHFAKDDNNDKGDDYLKLYSGNTKSNSSKPSLVIEYYVP